MVDSVVLPTETGEVGILPGHIPLLTRIVPGELQVANEGHIEFIAVDKGFAEVMGDKVSVLAEDAVNVHEIDLQSVEDARKRALEALQEAHEKGADPAEIEQLEAVARFALAKQLAKARKQ